MTTPNCTTHHKACDCREAMFSEMLSLARDLMKYDDILRSYAGPHDRLFDGDFARADAAYDNLILKGRALIARATDQGEMK